MKGPRLSLRFIIFTFGFLLFLSGAANHFERIPMPIDCTAIECSIGLAKFTLDVVLMVVGVFLMLIGWVFHRLQQ